MQHQRHAHGLEAAPGELRAVRGGRGGHAVAHHVRKIDPAALEEVAVLDDAREPATATGAIPAVAAEGLAVEGFETLDDALLQRGKPGFDGARIHSGLAPDRAVADVAAVLAAVEEDAVGDLIGALLRAAHVVAERGHAKHAPARGDDLAIL